MKSPFLIFTTCFVLFLFTQCTPDDKKEIFTLIYLDFSLSQDTTTLDKMISHVEEIYKSQAAENDAHFIVKLIEEREGGNPLFDQRIEGLNEGYTTEEEYERFLILKYGAKQLRDTILYSYNNIPIDASEKVNTCLCNTLDNVKYAIPTDTSLYEIRVVVISDLLEDCGKRINNLDQKIDLCALHNKKDVLDRIMTDVENNYVSNTNLKDFIKPENLFFILTCLPEYGDHNRCLNTNDTKAFWHVLLGKYGYSEFDLKGINGVTFSNLLPDQLLNKK